MKYRHTIEIELETQFPTPGDESEFMVRLGMILGPWCVSCRPIKINEEIEE